MAEFGIPPKSLEQKVFFAQLYGMSDFISMSLGECEWQNSCRQLTRLLQFSSIRTEDLISSEIFCFNFFSGQAGYMVHKSIPYGTIDEVLPYLSRRLNENSSILGGVRRERNIIRAALKGRFTESIS